MLSTTTTTACCQNGLLYLGTFGVEQLLELPNLGISIPTGGEEMRKRIVVLVLILIWSNARAENEKPGFNGETELGTSITSGNTSTENLAAKTENKYLLGKDLWSLSGRYLRNTTQDVETALFWDAGLRYDRVISDRLSFFVGYKSEADPYAGYVQRDSADLGAKYSFMKMENFYWLGELGYRYSKTHIIGDNTYASFLRLYTEVKQSLDKNTYAKLWIEYLPNLSNNEGYLVNSEASISAVLSEFLSLKISYLTKYQNEPQPGFEKTDSIFLTTLVAKY